MLFDLYFSLCSTVTLCRTGIVFNIGIYCSFNIIYMLYYAIFISYYVVLYNIILNELYFILLNVNLIIIWYQIVRRSTILYICIIIKVLYYIVSLAYCAYVGQHDLCAGDQRARDGTDHTCEHLYLQREDKCTTEWINHCKVLYVFVYREDACNAYTCPKCPWSPISSHLLLWSWVWGGGFGRCSLWSGYPSTR